MIQTDLERFFWHLRRLHTLTLAEVGFIAFLVDEIRESDAESPTVSCSDAYVCRKLRISRTHLRRIRTRLADICLLVTTVEGKGTTYNLYSENTGGEANLYSENTGGEANLYSENTGTAGHKTPSPLVPPSLSPRTPLNPPPYNPPTNPCGAGERGNQQAMPHTTGKPRDRPDNSLSLAPHGRLVEPSSEQEVVAYFRAQGFLHPEREGGKFWKTRYWQRRRDLDWQTAASLWNCRSLEYQEKHPHATAHQAGSTAGRSGDNREQLLAGLRARREAAARAAEQPM